MGGILKKNLSLNLNIEPDLTKIRRTENYKYLGTIFKTRKKVKTIN